jgi:hypothetical protein
VAERGRRSDALAASPCSRLIFLTPKFLRVFFNVSRAVRGIAHCNPYALRNDLRSAIDRNRPYHNLIRAPFWMLKGDEMTRNRSALSMGEHANSLFQIDPLWSSEFLDTFKRRMYLEPEKILMLAILQDAVTCMQKYVAFGSRENRRLFDEAKDWIESDDSEWLFSFNNVCEAVGLNPRYLRPRLIKMSELQAGSGLRRKVVSSAVTVRMNSATSGRT